MKKKFLATFIIVCTFIMSIGIISASAGTYEDLTYTVSNGEVTITNCNDSATSVDIPSTIEGYPVTSIGDEAFFLCCSLTSITIPDSVKSIGDLAFCCCESLTSITIPDNVISIGEDAFAECDRLTSVKIPDNVISIGDDAFIECISLKSVTIGNGVISIGNSAFCCCDSLTSVTIGSAKSIGRLAFSNCPVLDTVTMLEGVTSIGEAAFADCRRLRIVTIPKSVTSIHDWAFNMCESIDTIYYTGTEEEWNKIVVSPLDEAEIVFNYIIPSVETEIIKATSTATSLKFISKAIIEGEPEIATFGTTFIPLWLFEENSTDTVTVEYNNENYDIQNGQTFGATLTSIPESFKDIKIVGKSYIKTADGNYEWSTAKYATVNDTALKTVE